MPLILGTNSIKDTGFDVANSLRFNGDNFLSRTNPSATSTNDKKGTFSFWVKRASFPNGSQVLYHQADSSTKRFALQIANNDEFIFSIRNDAESVDIDGTTTLDTLYRDTSAWYHILFNYDTSGGTNGCKLFKNGVEQALTYSNTLPQNFVMQSNVSSFANHTIGRDSTQSSNFWTGYMAEVMFVDGQQLAPTEFGEYDEDSPTIWKAKDISGINVGNLGYYLDFENSGALGTDAKGVGNFSTTNCAATDQSTDTCTNNFCTWNPLDVFYSGNTYQEGNTQGTKPNNSVESFGTSTFGISSGKWYAEFKVISFSGSNSTISFGIIDRPSVRNDMQIGKYTYGIAYSNNGYITANDGSTHSVNTGVTFGAGDIVGLYIDLDNLEFYAAKNGTILNSGTGLAIQPLSSTANGVYFFGFDNFANGGSVHQANWGNPAYTGTDQADANGYGSFEYSPSSGTFDGASKDFYSLNTKNLSEFG